MKSNAVRIIKRVTTVTIRRTPSSIPTSIYLCLKCIIFPFHTNTSFFSNDGLSTKKFCLR